MAARIPLTDELTKRPFTVAEGRAAHLGRDRLLGHDLIRPTRSVRSAVPVLTVAQRAWAFRLAMPSDIAFSHLTAARLWNLWLPKEETDDEPLFVMRSNKQNRIRRSGVPGHRGLENRMVEQCRGMPVTSPADTWLDLAALLDVDDLIVLGDCIATRVESIEPLVEVLWARRRAPGRAKAAQALTLVRVGSKSPMETTTRLVIVRGGLPEPKLNQPILDADGNWIAEVDFLWEEERLVGEYQGEKPHDGPRARDADGHKRMLVEDQDYRHVEIFKSDIFPIGHRAQLLHRLAGRLNFDPARLTI